MKTRLFIQYIFSGLLGAVLLVPGTDAAQIDPKAESVLQEMATHLKEIKSFQVSTVWVTEATSILFHNESVSRAQIAVAKPNRFAFRLTGDTDDIAILSDGETLTSYLEEYRTVVTEPAPETLSEFSNHMAIRIIGQVPYHRFLLDDDPYSALVGDASKIVYHGIESKNGTPCHHLEVFRPGPNFDLFIEEGDHPVPRTIVPDASEMERRMSIQFPDIQIGVTFSYDDWKIDEPVDPAVFEFAVPDETFKKPSLLAMLQEGPPHALLGKPAPAFTLTKLDGTEFDLSKELGKKVVILDFWSMRCPPCVASLPTLAEVAKEYEDKGVVLLAVNLGEPSEMVANFLKNKNVDLPVGLDQFKVAASTYQVGPIPQTVLIGKTGKIETVHIGLPPDLKTRLSKEIDTLLAGKSLLD